jgi:hypothetical protein
VGFKNEGEDARLYEAVQVVLISSISQYSNRKDSLSMKQKYRMMK